MRIDVVGLHGLEVTDSMRAHAEEKTQKLLNHFEDLVQSASYRLQVEDTRGVKTFKVELVVGVRQHEDFVAVATGEDLYLTLDSSVNKADRQIRDHKDRTKIDRR